jgi:transcriptional regulator with PAS, ATPase and Fis domain
VIDHPGTTVLIVGETGTGKELLAKAVHNGGARRSSPFVAVNCSAIPDHLVESELFGHERGAFTDAHSTKPGLFEIADGGTLFLDEIGALPSPLQAKLLRVLQDGEVRRVGGTKARKVDVRILAATNENIGEAIRSGAFREDLYYRLGVITLSLPPLRERDEDAVVIAEALLDQLSEQHGVPTPAVRPEVRRVLLEYPWPGNVRELKNAVERALLLSPPGSLDTSELLPQSDVESRDAGLIPFPASLDDITAAAASATLDLCKGNRSAAARRLRISRRRLRRLLGEEQLTA